MTKNFKDRASTYTMERFFRVRRQQSSTPSVSSSSGSKLASVKKHKWSRSIKKKVPSAILKGRESLMDIIYSHHTEELERILDSGVEFKAIDPDGAAMVKATELGYTDMVACMLRSGVSAYDTGHGHLTPLHAAAKLGYQGIAALLVSNGARVNEHGKYERRTPLHLAVIERHPTLVDLLLNNGANIHSTDIYGQSALHMAARGGDAALVARLLGAGAEVNAFNNDGWTALHLAAATGYADTVQVLLVHHAHLDAQTKHGCTALHWACKHSHMKLAIRLVDAGAALHITDWQGKTAADCAENAELKQYLNTLLRNRRSIRFTGHPTVPRLNIPLTRNSSPFAQLADSTLARNRNSKVYTSYDDVFPHRSPSSHLSCRGDASSRHWGSHQQPHSVNPFFLDVPHQISVNHDDDDDDSDSDESSHNRKLKPLKRDDSLHCVDSDSDQSCGHKVLRQTVVEVSSSGHGSDTDNTVIDGKLGTGKELQVNSPFEVIDDSNIANNNNQIKEVSRSINELTKDLNECYTQAESLKARSKSVPFLVHAQIEPTLGAQNRPLPVSHPRAATLGSLFRPGAGSMDKDTEGDQLQVQAKLFSMINRMNQSIANLESKVSTMKVSSESVNNNNTNKMTSADSSQYSSDDDDVEDSEEDDEYNEVNEKDTDSAYTETDDAGHSDVTTCTTPPTQTTNAPPSVVLDHQPAGSKSKTNNRSNPNSKGNGDLKKQRVYKRKSLPLKNPQKSKNTRTRPRVKRHTECDANTTDCDYVSDTQSNGSSFSIKSDIQDVQDRIASLKQTFMTESDQIARMLIGQLEEDSTC